MTMINITILDPEKSFEIGTQLKARFRRCQNTVAVIPGKKGFMNVTLHYSMNRAVTVCEIILTRSIEDSLNEANSV